MKMNIGMYFGIILVTSVKCRIIFRIIVSYSMIPENFCLYSVVVVFFFLNIPYLIYQGPVVQSIVSLTSSLRGQLIECFVTL